MAGDVTGTVEERLSKVETQVVGLRGDVQTLRVLEEANAATIRLIAEGHGAKLDAHDAKLDAHGRKLDEITEALKPLAAIHDFVRRVAHEHEIRIVALESRDGGKQPEG